MTIARMIRWTVVASACWTLSTGAAAAQTQPPNLALLFEDIYGPNGLVVASQEVLLDGNTHAAHFNSAFQSDFRLVNIALTSQLAGIPVPSPASGFTYRFDSATGTFVRSTSSFGPILTDRADTIGRGRVAFGFNYQFFSFDQLDGVSLTAVPAVFRHDGFEAGGGRADVIATQNSIRASVSQFSTALTYGLTNRVDVSVAVPLVRTHLSLISNATIHRIGTATNTAVHYFPDPLAIDGRGSTHQFFATGSAGGIGDVLVRIKGTVFREGTRSLAAGVDLRFPTGDELNLLGAGAAGVRPFAAFSGAFGPVAPHLNLAYQWNGRSVLAGDVRSFRKADLPDQLLYAAGADVTVNRHFSIVADLLGQRVMQSPRLLQYTLTAAGPAGTVSLPDIRFTTSSYWMTSGAFGIKTSLAEHLLLSFNLRLAMTDSGLTDRVSPLMGAEWSF